MGPNPDFTTSWLCMLLLWPIYNTLNSIEFMGCWEDY